MTSRPRASNGETVGAASVAPTPHEAAVAFLGMVRGAERAGFLEIRRIGPRVVRTFFAVDQLTDAARYALALDGDVFAGMAPRVHESGRNVDVQRSWCLSLDADSDAALDALASFEPASSIVLRSGSVTDSGQPKLHAHWALREPLGADDYVRAKRHLASTLHGDSRICDAARVMRLPGTRNHKTAPASAVTLERLKVASEFTAEQVVGQLPPPPPPETARRATPLVDPQDLLRGFSPPDYIAALLGEDVPADGKIKCPFHADRSPSLHAYAAPEDGWYCYGCDRGGSIIDFASALNGVEARGAGSVRSASGCSPPSWDDEPATRRPPSVRASRLPHSHLAVAPLRAVGAYQAAVSATPPPPR